MTNEEIDAMSAGREMDKLVAELVTKPSFEGHPMFTGDWAVDRTSVHLWKDLRHQLLLPFYSTDIAAAWLVVEKMVSQLDYDHIGYEWYGPNFKPETHYLTREGYPLGTTCWYVRVCWGGLIHMVCADTAPLAVCRAALKAVSLGSGSI